MDDLRWYIEKRRDSHQIAINDIREAADRSPADLATSASAYLLSEMAAEEALRPYWSALSESEDMVATVRQQIDDITDTVLRYTLYGPDDDPGFSAAAEIEYMQALAQYALDLRRILRSGEENNEAQNG